MFRIRVNKFVTPWEINFEGKLPERYRDRSDSFFSKYSIIKVICNSIYPNYEPKPKNERICRFCKKSYPLVTFKNDAHLIPQLMGNKKLVSYYECDQCNDIFSKNETDLSYFLGISRTISYAEGRNGIPLFQSPDKKLIIKKGFLNENDKSPKLVLETHDPTQNHFRIDKEKGKIIINATKHSYVPFNVYKSILKIALSSIDDDEVGNYEKTINMLFNPNSDQNNPLLKIFIFMNPGPSFPSPLILLFKKKDVNEVIPTHIFCIYFQNYIYQIAIPFNLKDKWMYDGIKQILIESAPPFVDINFAEHYGYPQLIIKDLNGNEKIKNERQEIVLSYNKLIKPIKYKGT